MTKGLRYKVAILSVMCTIACCFALVPAAFASDVAWNTHVHLNAQASDATYSSTAQNINVTMVFASGTNLSNVTSETATTYLNAHTQIAGRHIDGTTSSSYVRPVSNTVIDDSADTITFTIGPLSSGGIAANYSGELLITADNEANSYIYSAMGGSPVETLICTQMAITAGTVNSSSATFSVSALPQCRAMNHILILDGSSPVFSGTGTFSNGGLTVHSHYFYQPDTYNVNYYASTIVSTANTLKAEAVAADSSASIANYTFTYNTDTATFTVTKITGSCANISVVMYNGDYLNLHSLGVGDIYEEEM